jgi:plastocyanin
MALFRQSATWVFTAGLLGVACGGGDGGTPPPTLTIEINNGNNQVGNPGQPLASPFAVLVKENGTPKAGETVTWAATTGGGSVNPGTSQTGMTGIATTVLTPGADSVVQRVTAAAGSGTLQTFTATARIQGATQIAVSSGSPHTGDSVLSTYPISVLVRDETSSPVVGVNVSWAVPGGQGSVSPTSSMSDASGIASVDRTLGTTAGTQTATATVRGLAGSPVQFTATATAGNAFQIAASGGSGSHAVNSSFTLSAIVRDQHANPRSGVIVTWGVDPATGSVDPNPSTTGTNGIATTTRMLGPTEGTYTDTAYASVPQGSPVLFNGTAIAAPQSATVNLGDFFFRSARNNTSNEAVDTIGVGGTVTWNWSGATAHNVQSRGAPTFPSSSFMTGTGSYPRTFGTAGTYAYECGAHPQMIGRVVVLP